MGKKYSELELPPPPTGASRPELEPIAVPVAPVPASERLDLELDSFPVAETSPVVRCPPPPEQMRTNSRHIMTTALSYRIQHISKTVCDSSTNGLGSNINPPSRSFLSFVSKEIHAIRWSHMLVIPGQLWRWLVLFSSFC